MGMEPECHEQPTDARGQIVQQGRQGVVDGERISNALVPSQLRQEDKTKRFIVSAGKWVEPVITRDGKPLGVAEALLQSRRAIVRPGQQEGDPVGIDEVVDVLQALIFDDTQFARRGCGLTTRALTLTQRRNLEKRLDIVDVKNAQERSGRDLAALVEAAVPVAGIRRLPSRLRKVSNWPVANTLGSNPARLSPTRGCSMRRRLASSRVPGNSFVEWRTS